MGVGRKRERKRGKRGEVENKQASIGEVWEHIWAISSTDYHWVQHSKQNQEDTRPSKKCQLLLPTDSNDSQEKSCLRNKWVWRGTALAGEEDLKILCSSINNIFAEKKHRSTVSNCLALQKIWQVARDLGFPMVRLIPRVLGSIPEKQSQTLKGWMFLTVFLSQNAPCSHMALLA